MYKYYNYDTEHIQYYWECSKNKNDFETYLDKYVFNVENHCEYLEKIGIEKLMALRADPYLGY
jgi:hypothetical protein